jgi:hypothetical protein
MIHSFHISILNLDSLTIKGAEILSPQVQQES